jgi:hypothetical protein
MWMMSAVSVAISRSGHNDRYSTEEKRQSDDVGNGDGDQDPAEGGGRLTVIKGVSVDCAEGIAKR